MRNEVRSQRLLQFMQMTQNEQMSPFVKYDYILRELAASMDLDEDKILNDPREAAIQQKMMAEIKALMPEQPAPPPQAGPAQGGAEHQEPLYLKHPNRTHRALRVREGEQMGGMRHNLKHLHKYLYNRWPFFSSGSSF